jgi:uncharacterized protein with PIN domain|uniref:DUF5615 domain-containing protein n=2 Tax=unclassified Caudoviricetes TaxID=2788787 RepID=A0A8S5NIT0_9CAUD|nr:MAG TPA: protein of unknown function (DUF5615) [Siphoviridae sp. ctUF252]DAE01558.1 MAG TPA: protein of unknown function (DUF5615) [Siphoviridae sp. ctZHt25]DAT05039.1 MAG TPA: protein of unknown function (DUF5615) [Caudoviricetes sp.]
MKVLLDENVAMKLEKGLAKCGVEDVVHINNIKKGMKDTEVYELAKREQRLIVSGDRHFSKKKKELCKGTIFITPSAKKLEDLPEKICWIIDNISNYNIDILTSTISLSSSEYNVFYKKGMKRKAIKKTILYSKIKFKRVKV